MHPRVRRDRGRAVDEAISQKSYSNLLMNGLTLPSNFPQESFARIYRAVEPYRQQASYIQFIGAWNAVAYRFTAMVEYDERFTASIKANGPGPAEPLRYEQERDLFGFASNAYSMFDAFHYGMYVIGTFTAPQHFKLETEWRGKQNQLLSVPVQPSRKHSQR
jgi:hypothetical protein